MQSEMRLTEALPSSVHDSQRCSEYGYPAGSWKRTESTDSHMDVLGVRSMSVHHSAHLSFVKSQ